MINIFHNLSGEKWLTKRIEWWYFALYTPWFGVSINIHPNRYRQFFRGE